MGANLSKDVNLQVDTSKDIIAPEDRLSEVILGILWLGAVYGIVMIYTTVQLLIRWAGPHGERGFNACSIFAAFMVATAWPVVLLWLAMN